MTEIILNKKKFAEISYISTLWQAQNNSVKYDIEIQMFLLFLLLNCAEESYLYRNIEIKSGQLLITKREMHDALKISYPKLDEFLTILQEKSFIEFEEITINKTLYILIGLINCAEYQIKDVQKK